MSTLAFLEIVTDISVTGWSVIKGAKIEKTNGDVLVDVLRHVKINATMIMLIIMHHASTQKPLEKHVEEHAEKHAEKHVEEHELKATGVLTNLAPPMQPIGQIVVETITTKLAQEFSQGKNVLLDGYLHQLNGSGPT